MSIQVSSNGFASLRPDVVALGAPEADVGGAGHGPRQDYADFVKPRVAELLSAVDLDVVYHRASGDYLWYQDATGRERRVLDMLGGFGASLFGHNRAELVDSLRRELEAQRPFNAQASVRGRAAQLGRRLSDLVERSTGQRYVVTFANSGAEVVEAALKHAEMEAFQRRKQLLEGMQRAVSFAHNVMAQGGDVFVPGQVLNGRAVSGLSRAELATELDALLAAAEATLSRPATWVAVRGSFHGKTSGALRLTHSATFRGPWVRWGHASFIAPDDPDALARILAAATCTFQALSVEGSKVRVAPVELVNVAAIFCEPIQGEGGVRELSPELLRALRAAADQHGIPLVIDEIQSGMGRTGRFLASEWQGVSGDYYLLSKSLGGGLTKLAALLVDRRRYVHEFGYLHTSTFAEDDHSCSVALSALDLLERDDGALLARCARKGELLLAGLRELAGEFPEQIAEVRGRGLMVGIALKPQLDSVSPLLRVLSQQKLLSFFLAGHLLREHDIRLAPTLSEHGTLRVEPSAEIADAELLRFVAALRASLLLVRNADIAGLCSLELPPAALESGPRAPIVAVGPPASVSLPQPRVAFLAHLRDARDLSIIEPRLRGLSEPQCNDMVARIRSVLTPFTLGQETIRSALGNAIELTVVAVPFTAAQAQAALRGHDREWLLEQVHAAVALAADGGASIVGCGGYTSIVSDNCQALQTRGFGVTSGNSLTAAAAVEALFGAADTAGVGRRVLGVVGATGNIGAMLAELAADSVERVILVGRPGAISRLERVAARLPCPTELATELSALRECSLVVSATNAPEPILLPEHFSDGPVVVCDAAVPSDVSRRVVREKPNLVLLRGGLLRLPLGQQLGLEGVSVAPGTVYACLAESAVLGLSHMRGSFSYGALDIDRVRLIRTLARHHGFEVEANAHGRAGSWRGNDD